MPRRQLRCVTHAGRGPTSESRPTRTSRWTAREYKWWVCVRYRRVLWRDDSRPRQLSKHTHTHTHDHGTTAAVRVFITHLLMMLYWMRNRDQFSVTKAFSVIELFKWSSPAQSIPNKVSLLLFCPFLTSMHHRMLFSHYEYFLFFFFSCARRVILVNLRMIIHSFCHPHIPYASVPQCNF